MNNGYTLRKIINEICDFFTEYSDIQITQDPIINNRMREVLLENTHVNQLIRKELYLRSINASSDETIDCLGMSYTFDTLCKMMAIGWFNYDRYTKQYSNVEMDDIIEYTIGKILDNNAMINDISNSFEHINL
jgi:hypothetical protein